MTDTLDPDGQGAGILFPVMVIQDGTFTQIGDTDHDKISLQIIQIFVA